MKYLEFKINEVKCYTASVNGLNFGPVYFHPKEIGKTITCAGIVMLETKEVFCFGKMIGRAEDIKEINDPDIKQIDNY